MNDKDKHLFLKLAEELNELAVEILHLINKPNKNNHKKITSEIKDVEKYIEEIKKLL